MFNLYFTEEEMMTFLRKKGYTVEPRVISMAYHEYHNQVSYDDVQVFAVSKDGADIQKPSGYSFSKYDWLKDVFRTEIRKAILSI